MFSFDESSQQFTTNNIRVWSLNKPQIARDTNKYKCKCAGSYSFTSDGKDDIVFLENSKKESIVEVLKNLRKKNFKGVILLLIDNFSSHISKIVKNFVKEINIELCFLPTYSPQLQPEKEVLHEIKRKTSEFKVDNYDGYKFLKKDEKEEILKSFVEKSFYDIVPSKNKWNKISNNYIKPLIKLFNPHENTDWEVQKIY
ncbi:MAG: transposase [Methanobrevibacter sp.]|nr:transposase [Candidatus Methanovirga aequatorialis]